MINQSKGTSIVGSKIGAYVHPPFRSEISVCRRRIAHPRVSGNGEINCLIHQESGKRSHQFKDVCNEIATSFEAGSMQLT